MQRNLYLKPTVETHSVKWNGRVQERQFVCLHHLIEELPSVQVGCVDLESLVAILKPYMKQGAQEFQRDQRDAA